MQASLNYFNADYNLLTRMFAIEYSFWFDAMMPGLDDTGIPLPLGGTSNHFYADRLREIGSWDPYNVTEDADLGLRAYAEGYRVSVIQSTTWEEACSQTKAWIRQPYLVYAVTPEATINMMFPKIIVITPNNRTQGGRSRLTN